MSNKATQLNSINVDPKSAESAAKKHDWLSFFIHEFEKESDRAAVILTAAMLDEALRELVESFLIPCPASDDPLFDGANAPIGTFSSRIECAYRFGLITVTFAKSLHIIRKIRNTFAHDVAGCKFTSHAVSNRVSALKKSLSVSNFSAGEKKTLDLNDPRECFSYMAGYFLWQIKKRSESMIHVSNSDAICCHMKKEALKSNDKNKAEVPELDAI